MNYEIHSVSCRKQRSVLVSVGSGHNRRIADVGSGDFCVFAVDDDEEEGGEKVKMKLILRFCLQISKTFYFFVNEKNIT